MAYPEQPDKTIEELIAIALASTPGDEGKELDEVDRFIVACGIKPGTANVILPQVWHLYKQWADKPMKQTVFYRKFKARFNQYRNRVQRFYRLDPTPFDLSKETYFALRAEVRNKRDPQRRRLADAKKAKRDQEKQSKISGTDEGSKS